jgi:hypothetical protein
VIGSTLIHWVSQFLGLGYAQVGKIEGIHEGFS